MIYRKLSMEAFEALSIHCEKNKIKYDVWDTVPTEDGKMITEVGLENWTTEILSMLDKADGIEQRLNAGYEFAQDDDDEFVVFPAYIIDEAIEIEEGDDSDLMIKSMAECEELDEFFFHSTQRRKMRKSMI